MPPARMLIETPFHTSSVQVWRLAGLNCWHRTLLQQQADGIRQRLLSAGTQTPQLRWDWSDSELNEFYDPSTMTIEGDWDILVVSCTYFERLLFQLPEENWGRGNSRRVILLWDWTRIGSLSIQFASGLGLSGAITDPQSLRHWIQVLLTRGRTRREPAHLLLASITIPSLQNIDP